MSEQKKGVFIIYASPNGRDQWTLCRHEELPLWLLDPDVLGQLVNGMVAMKADEGERGSLFYRAEVKLGAQDAHKLKVAIREKNKREAARLLMVSKPSDEAFITIERSTLQH